MARSCPSCGRPNSDAATKCLYCVAPLAPAESEEAASRESGPPSSDRQLLILIPGDDPDEDRIRELSRVAGVSLYDARLGLSARRARLFRRLASEPEARRLSEQLAGIAIPHYVVPEAAVSSLPVVNASGLEVHERHLELRLEATASGSLVIGFHEMLLLVRGEIARERHDEKRLGSTRGASRPLTAGLKLHLYRREANFAVEVDPERFDFEVLGPERTSSVHLNLDRLVARLTAEMPEVELDRGFDQETPVLSRASGEDLASLLAQNERGPDGILYDNEAQFRFYASWRYRLARYLALLSTGRRA